MILGEDWIHQLEEHADELGLTDTMVCLGGKPPAEFSENRAFHVRLIDDLSAEAKRREWPGAEFCFYMRRDGFVSIYIAPVKGGELTLSGLAEHREAQKTATSKPPELVALV